MGDPSPSRLQAELAGQILRLLQHEGAGAGRRLVEQELCERFGVSRTPVRGALKWLAAQGVLEARAKRGFVLRKAVTAVPAMEPADVREEDDRRLFVEIAKARNVGRLPEQCSQQELVRLFGAKLTTVGRVLRQLAEMGLAERKPGNFWSFAPSINSAAAEDESYAFREALEPAALLQPGFRLDLAWAASSRERHLAFARRPWRNTLAVDFFKLTADFHERLAAASGNRYYEGAVRQQNQLRAFLNYHWHYGPARVAAVVEEHLAILDALEAGQHEVAAELMRRHLDRSKGARGPNPEDGFRDAPGK